MNAPSEQVLVVDDDTAVRNALKFSLELEGLEVRAYDGAEALLAEPNLPLRGCVVVDYFMPTMNGVDLVRSLRRRGINLPVILITSGATDDLRRHAARAGIAHILEKPLDDSSLLDSLRAVMKLASAPGSSGTSLKRSI